MTDAHFDELESFPSPLVEASRNLIVDSRVRHDINKLHEVGPIDFAEEFVNRHGRPNFLRPEEFDRELGQTAIRVYILASSRTDTIASTLASLAMNEEAPVAPVILSGPKDKPVGTTDKTLEIAGIFGVPDNSIVEIDSPQKDKLHHVYSAMFDHMVEYEDPDGFSLITDAETYLPRNWVINWQEFMSKHPDQNGLLASGLIRPHSPNSLRKPIQLSADLLRYAGSTVMALVRDNTNEAERTVFQMNSAIALRRNSRILPALQELSAGEIYALQKDFQMRDTVYEHGGTVLMNWGNFVVTDSHRFRTPIDVVQVILNPNYRLKLHDLDDGIMYSKDSNS